MYVQHKFPYNNDESVCIDVNISGLNHLKRANRVRAKIADYPIILRLKFDTNAGANIFGVSQSKFYDVREILRKNVLANKLLLRDRGAHPRTLLLRERCNML